MLLTCEQMKDCIISLGSFVGSIGDCHRSRRSIRVMGVAWLNLYVEDRINETFSRHAAGHPVTSASGTCSHVTPLANEERGGITKRREVCRLNRHDVAAPQFVERLAARNG